MRGKITTLRYWLSEVPGQAAKTYDNGPHMRTLAAGTGALRGSDDEHTASGPGPEMMSQSTPGNSPVGNDKPAGSNVTFPGTLECAASPDTLRAIVTRDFAAASPSIKS